MFENFYWGHHYQRSSCFGRCLSCLSGTWVDVFTDSKVLIHSWGKQGSRSKPLFDALKRIFSQMQFSNIFLNLNYIPSSGNLADLPSRRLYYFADASLSPPLYMDTQLTLWRCHPIWVLDWMGHHCHFFSPFPFASAAGVNELSQSCMSHSHSLFRNPYAFPPPLLDSQFLVQFRKTLQYCDEWRNSRVSQS